MRDKSKLERAQLAYKVERIGRMALVAVLSVKLLMQLEVIRSEDLYFIIAVSEMIMWLFVITTGCWRQRWSKKLCYCPFCTRFDDKAAYQFLRHRQQQYICPHCGRLIFAMEEKKETEE